MQVREGEMEYRDRPEVHAFSNMGSLLAQSPWDPPAPAKLQNNESVAAKPKPGVKNLWNVTQSHRPREPSQTAFPLK